jgi:hypothetical protein
LCRTAGISQSSPDLLSSPVTRACSASISLPTVRCPQPRRERVHRRKRIECLRSTHENSRFQMTVAPGFHIEREADQSSQPFPSTIEVSTPAAAVIARL